MHSTPTPQVRASEALSKSLDVRNRMWQGCLLSLLSLYLPWSLFYIKILANSKIYRIKVGQSCHKVSAYTDDLLFFISEPDVSVPNLMVVFQQYRTLSNCKIHFLHSLLGDPASK